MKFWHYVKAVIKLDTIRKTLYYKHIQIMKDKEIKPPTMIQDTKSVSGNRLMVVEIKRDKEGGLKITLQSDPNLWSFMRREGETIYSFAGVPCFYPKSSNLQGVNSYFMTDEQFYEFENYPNLAMLLARDIGQGVTFSFGAFPVSEQKLQEWVRLLKEQVKIIYLSYIKPVDVVVEISAQTVERDVNY